MLSLVVIEVLLYLRYCFAVLGLSELLLFVGVVDC